MRALSYVYDSRTADEHVAAVLDELADRAETVDRQDVGTAADREAALREAMLTVRESTRIGSAPDGLFDESGALDFSPGVLVTEDETGRRSLHVGTEALEALEADAGEP